jgi:hypothetical protein
MIKVALLGWVWSFGSDDGQTAFGQPSGEGAPAGIGPSFVSVERACVQDRIGPRRSHSERISALRTDKLATGVKPKSTGYGHQLRNPMDIGFRGDRNVVRIPFPGAGLARPRDEPDPETSRKQSKQRRPVARLRGHNEVISAKQPCGQGNRLAKRRPLRRRYHPVDVGIAAEHALAAAEYEHIQRSFWKTPADAADERRREQHIAEPAQRDDQYARPRRKIKLRTHVLSVTIVSMRCRLLCWRDSVYLSYPQQ